jgi:hypothetical protein
MPGVESGPQKPGDTQGLNKVIHGLLVKDLEFYSESTREILKEFKHKRAIIKVVFGKVTEFLCRP